MGKLIEYADWMAGKRIGIDLILFAHTVSMFDRLVCDMLSLNEDAVVAILQGNKSYLTVTVKRRLKFLDEIVVYLYGSYTFPGMRQWFLRKRRELGNRSPCDVLRGNWKPTDREAQKVLRLAKQLV